MGIESFILRLAAFLLSIYMICGIFFFHKETIRPEFENVCSQHGGQTVFDGKKYQCLK